MTLTALLLISSVASHAAKPKGTLDKALHKHLHNAEDNPSAPPPPYILDEADQARLNKNEMVFHYEHLKGHDLAFCAVTTWADKWEVWRAVKALNEYPEYLEQLDWAKLGRTREEGGVETLEASMHIEIPLLPGDVSVRGYHHIQQGFLSFHMINAKEKNPFKHGMGYWSVTDFSEGRTLVMMMVDVLPDFPIPNAQRGQIAESTMPYFVWNVARRAENEFNKRETSFREVD